MFILAPAVAQNTKGDRAINNQKKVRETKGKSVKKKSKATTKDVAGRRLRTKNKSSANRANVGIKQPETTSRQPRRVTDRAARMSTNKRVVSRERRSSDPDRSWQGDISGYKARKIKPSSAEETGRNVYPQKGYTSKHPKADRPFKSTHRVTASGKPIVKRTPQRTERAWKGDIKGQPFFPPTSRTGSTSNVHPQRTRYSKYVSKAPSGRDKPFSNRESIAKARRMGTNPAPKNWKTNHVITSTGQAPYVTRGRKNVYWGKMKRTERGSSKDISGRALRTRNFRSAGMGLVGRDTLRFFSRKPGEGSLYGNKKRNGRFISGSEAKGGWLNDIAGFKLRNKRAGGSEQPGSHGYSGFRSVTGKYRHNQKVQNKTPGIGAAALANGLKRTKGRDMSNYGDQGGGFSGVLKAKRKDGAFNGSKTGGLWNNNRTPVSGKILAPGAERAGRYSGNLRGGKNFGDQGGGFTGVLKQQKRGSYIGSRHVFWNNGGSAIQGKLLGPGADRAGRFSGNIRGGGKDYGDQGGGFTGVLKQQKRGSYVGTRHMMWNNNMKSTTQLNASRAAMGAGSFQGHTKPSARGESVAKTRGSWNNNMKSTTQLNASRGAVGAGSFQGRTKAKEQRKGDIMSTPNVLWNNNEKATTQVRGTKAGINAGLYQGRLKAKEKKEYELASNRKSWNNDGKATTQLNATKAAGEAGQFHGGVKVKKVNKNNEADIESRSKLKREYTQNQYAVEEATKKQKPHSGSGKGGQFASGAKVVGTRQHHPHSVSAAVDGYYYNKASGKAVDYQGNVKMRKFLDRRESPDAKFVHIGENNVKEDRTIVTNVKLFWAKLFQKSESQPANLKDRSNKMRYDKGEKGMWND